MSEERLPLATAFNAYHLMGQICLYLVQNKPETRIIEEPASCALQQKQQLIPANLQSTTRQTKL